MGDKAAKDLDIIEFPACGAGSGDALGRLVARIESARGPDLQLDDALAAALPAESAAPEHKGEAYTGSLDAVMRLMQNALPAWEIEAFRYGPFGGARVAIWPQGLRPERSFEAHAATLELALLTAVIKAMAAREDDAGGVA